jgi:hypothetical protein
MPGHHLAVLSEEREASLEVRRREHLPEVARRSIHRSVDPIEERDVVPESLEAEEVLQVHPGVATDLGAAGDGAPDHDPRSLRSHHQRHLRPSADSEAR